LRIFLYVQHLLGIGHLKRASLLAETLSSKGYQVLLVTGGLPNQNLLQNLPNICQLPPLYTKDENFELLTSAGNKADSPYMNQRRKILLDAFDNFKPDLLITEHFPFGRYMLKGELTPLLEKAKNNNIKILASVRDILVTLPPSKILKIKEILNDYYDAVLIHGDQKCAIYWTDYTNLKPQLFFTGYIHQKTDQTFVYDNLWTQRPVLAFQGGRNTDYNCLDLLREAKPKTIFKDNPWIIIGTQNNDYLKEGIIIQKSIPHLSNKLNQCAFIISEAGYNSFLEIILSEIPSLFIPFYTQKEDEQLKRLQLYKEILNLNYLTLPFINTTSIQKQINPNILIKKSLDIDGLNKSEKIIKDLM
jgi:predicted glycosyltransferase